MDIDKDLRECIDPFCEFKVSIDRENVHFWFIRESSLNSQSLPLLIDRIVFGHRGMKKSMRILKPNLR